MQVDEVPGPKAVTGKPRATTRSAGGKPVGVSKPCRLPHEQVATGFGEVIDRDGAHLPSLLLLVLMSSAPALPLSEMHAPAVSALDDLWGKRKLISEQARLSSETVTLTYSMVDLIRSVID